MENNPYDKFFQNQNNKPNGAPNPMNESDSSGQPQDNQHYNSYQQQDSSQKIPTYNQPQPPGYPFQQPMDSFQQQSKNAASNRLALIFSILSIILGALSLILCCLSWVAVIIGVAGFIFGRTALKKNPLLHNLAIPGILLSVVGAFLGVLTFFGIISNVLGLDTLELDYIFWHI